MDAATIMLIPDDTYKAARPRVREHHLTVAFYGAASQQGPEAKRRLYALVDGLAGQYVNPIKARANGVGMFVNDGEVAIVDLIDGYGVCEARYYVESYGGLKIDRRHGFTPHMTVRFASDEDPDVSLTSDDALGLDFTFVAVAAWWNDERYEVAL